MIDWNKRNGGFLSTESVYEDQLSNLSAQIQEKDKEIERLNNIIKKVRERVLNERKPLPSPSEILEILDKENKV